MFTDISSGSKSKLNKHAQAYRLLGLLFGPQDRGITTFQNAGKLISD
jgi:hypothetical protein